MNQKRFHFYCCRFYENGQLVEGPRLLAVKEVLAVVMSRDFLKKELLVLNDTERNITYPHLHIDTGIDDSYLLLLINRKVVTKSINMFESVSDLVLYGHNNKNTGSYRNDRGLSWIATSTCRCDKGADVYI